MVKEGMSVAKGPCLVLEVDLIILHSLNILPHPKILSRKPIESPKNLRIHPKFRSRDILEMIWRLQLLILNNISLIRRKFFELPDD